MRITTVSSGRTTTQAVTSGEPSDARMACGPSEKLKPIASPPTAAEPMTKRRRFISPIALPCMAVAGLLGEDSARMYSAIAALARPVNTEHCGGELRIDLGELWCHDLAHLAQRLRRGR